MNLLDQNANNQYNPSYHTGSAGCLTPTGFDHYDQQRKIDQQFKALQERHNASMTTKLTKVAELFELDVLSEEEALKACSKIIYQHAKSNHEKYAKLGPEEGVKIVK